MKMPTLRTHRIVLRPFAQEDAPRVQELAGAREVALGTLTIPHPYEDGVAEEWIGSLEEQWRGRDALMLAMVTKIRRAGREYRAGSHRRPSCQS